MYNGLLHAHSGLRWLVLIALIWALFKSVSGWLGNKEYEKGDRLAALFGMIFCHIQVLVGLFLYFISPKVAFVDGMMQNDVLRFFSVEHILMMAVGIALITAGFSAAKRTTHALTKHKKVALYYGIGLLIILAGIPWPFRELGAGWF